MNPDDAVDFRYHNRSRCETVRLDHRWDGLEAEHIVIRRPKLYDFSLHSGRHYLALLNANREDGETTADDLPRSTLRDFRDRLTFIPAGCRLQGWSLPGKTPITFTAVSLDPKIFLQLDAGEPQLYPMLYFEHPFLTQMMLQLDRILAQPENYSRMYAESFVIVLMSEIMNCQAGFPQQRSSAGRRSRINGGLASWQCKAVCDYIEANLHQDISLAELAAIVRLSPYHFCRAFKQALGVPPHRYQMARRIIWARTLLTDHSLSIAEVAKIIGYGSASRFSALFRQFTGHSPRSFRRQMV